MNPSKANPIPKNPREAIQVIKWFVYGLAMGLGEASAASPTRRQSDLQTWFLVYGTYFDEAIDLLERRFPHD